MEAVTILSVLAALILCMMAFILLSPGKEDAAAASVTIDLGGKDGRIVRVRSADGPWMSFTAPYPLGGMGEDLPDLSPDDARRDQPELYAEYMDPVTPPERKMEVADLLYGMGYILPLQRDLIIHLRGRMADAAVPEPRSAATVPVDLGRRLGRMEVDRSVGEGLIPEDTEDIQEEDIPGEEDLPSPQK